MSKPIGAQALLIGLAVLAGCAAAPPRLPAIDQGFTPRPQLSYGDWVATRPTLVYAAEGDRTRPAFQLAPHESVTAMTGNIHRLAHGAVRFKWGGSVTVANGDELALWPLEEVVLLRRVTEESWDAWARGQEVTLVIGPECSGVEHFDVQLPKEEWWVHVRTRQGRTGWVLIDDPDAFERVTQTQIGC